MSTGQFYYFDDCALFFYIFFFGGGGVVAGESFQILSKTDIVRRTWQIDFKIIESFICVNCNNIWHVFLFQ